MTEALCSALSNISALRVPGRSTVMRYEIDPKFAPAYAGASMAYPYLSLPHGEKMAHTRDFAQQAIDLDPQLGDGYVARGLHSVFEAWNWTSADADFRRAIELNPNSVLALSSHAYLLVALGLFEDMDSSRTGRDDRGAGGPRARLGQAR